LNLNRDIRALGTTVTVRVYTESYNDRGDLNTSSYTDYTTVAYIDIYAGDTIYSPEGEVITADAFGYFQTDAGNYLDEGVEVIHNRKEPSLVVSRIHHGVASILKVGVLLLDSRKLTGRTVE